MHCPAKTECVEEPYEWTPVGKDIWADGPAVPGPEWKGASMFREGREAGWATVSAEVARLDPRACGLHGRGFWSLGDWQAWEDGWGEQVNLGLSLTEKQDPQAQSESGRQWLVCD